MIQEKLIKKYLYILRYLIIKLIMKKVFPTPNPTHTPTPSGVTLKFGKKLFS